MWISIVEAARHFDNDIDTHGLSERTWGECGEYAPVLTLSDDKVVSFTLSIIVRSCRSLMFDGDGI